MRFFSSAYLSCFFLTIIFLGCKKTESASITKQTEDANSLDKIKVSSLFNWSTYNDVTLSINGIPALASEKNTLTVTSLDDTTLFLTGFYSMADNIEESFKLPKVTEEVKVSFGSISKNVKVSDGKIKFSYVSDAPHDQD